MPIIRDRRMSLSGGDIAYTIAGTGPEVLLLIHGLGGDRHTWRHLIPALASSHTVIAPDLPGHGDSDPPAGDYSLGAHACAMRDLFVALGFSRVSLIGHSLGGGVALQTAYQFPERIGRVVLISSGGLGPEVSLALRAATLPGSDAVVAGLSRLPAALTGGFLRVMPALMTSSDARVVAQALQRLDGKRQRRAFVRTARAVIDWRGQTVSADRQLGLLSDVPVLVTWGTKDTIIPPHHHRSFAERVPHAVMTELADVGHFPQETAPEQVSLAIERFVATTAAAGYAEERWTDLLTTPPQAREAPTTDARMASAADRLNETARSRRVIDTAIGVLTELRRCSEREAIRELVDAGRRPDMDIAAMARGLVALRGHEDVAEDLECAAAQHHWRHLLAARREPGSAGPAVLRSDVAIRYGGVTANTWC